MPKKGKKGKKSGKKSGKGKKKGAKGNKEKKEINAIQMSVANSAVWELRMHALERERNEFKEKAIELIDENEQLYTQIRKTEKDTIDVVSYLKKVDQQKEESISKLEENIKELRKQHREEKEAAIAEMTKQLDQVQDQLSQKHNEVQLLQSELRQVKEFRRKRTQMQKELDEIKDAMQLTNKEHSVAIQRLEDKFFEEKMKLQQEANHKISELAERAHQEAIANLDETTKDVFKENVRLQEALKHHTKEADQLRKTFGSTQEQIVRLKTELELAQALSEEKIKENRQQKAKIRELEEKIANLEKALSTLVQEFEADTKETKEKFDTDLNSAQTELQRVRRMLLLQTKEMLKLRTLSRTILEQRTEIEQFFLDSLDLVKREIRENQRQYVAAAERAFNERMRAAHAGAANYPKVRTFNKGLGGTSGLVDASTNSVFQDLEAAEKLMDDSSKIDIADLTWEQREKVLRYLFAKMNNRVPAPSQTPTSGSLLPLPPASWPTNSPFPFDPRMLMSGEKMGVLPPIAESNSSNMQASLSPQAITFEPAVSATNASNAMGVSVAGSAFVTQQNMEEGAAAV